MNRTGKPYEIDPMPLEISVALRSRMTIGESPSWREATQQLYLADISGQEIHSFRPSDGSHRRYRLPDWVTSLSIREQGGLVLSMRKTFAFYDPEAGHLEILADPEPERPGNRFNDGRCDPQGRLWAGTMGAEDWRASTGAVYRFDPDQRITRMIDGVRCSNGTGWSPDGQTMYHTQSFRYQIFAYDFDGETGAIGNGRPFVTLDPDAGGFPDGLTVDSEGFVWSAQPVYGRLVRYDPDGAIDRIIALPVSRGTSCTFGGPDYRTLFITSATETLTRTELAEEPLAGSLLACTPGVRGMPPSLFAG
jgi:sugar lactone lactonase YvrE